MMSHPPQWHQDANRDSAIVDPVVEIQELTRFKPLRATRIDYALVFTTAKGRRDAFMPPHRPGRGEPAARRWTTMYTVDIGLHETRTVLTLPSRDDAFLFEVGLRCSWQVTDPAAFVGSGERDVPAMVWRIVDDLVRPVLRSYAIESSHAAEKDAQAALAAAGPLGARAGLNVHCALQVRQDDAALRHARELREIEYARQKLEPQHALEMQADELESARELARDRQRHEQEMARARQELERQKIEAEKIEYYTYWLERGGPAQMAFHLARHPDDARLVMENLRKDQLLAIQAKLDVAMQALGGGPGGLEEHQLDEPRRLAANVIREVLTRELAPGSAGNGTPAVEGAPARAVGDGREEAAEANAAPAAESARSDGPDAADGPAATAPEARKGAGPPEDTSALFGYRIPPQPPAS